MAHFERFFDGAENFWTVTERRKGQLWGQKGGGPLKNLKKWPFICLPKTKDNITHFKIIGVRLVFLYPYTYFGPF
jgi:hypothetical protein